MRLLEPVQERHPEVSWADLIQMAGALGVELTGGPVIEHMRYGRMDAPNFHEERGTFTCPVLAYNAAEEAPTAPAVAATQEGRASERAKDRRMHMHANDVFADSVAPLAGRLPQALPPYPDGATIPGVHIRNVFYRLGFNNKEIVALCGAHTIGRAFSDRSKCTTNSSGPQGATKYTRPTACPWAKLGSAGAADGEQETRSIGMPGGCSWTRNWQQFDNSYFQEAAGQSASTDSDSKAALSTLQHMRRSSLTAPAAADAAEGAGKVMLPQRYAIRKPVSANWAEHGRDPELLWLPTDNALQTDPEFRAHFQLYARDQAVSESAHVPISRAPCPRSSILVDTNRPSPSLQAFFADYAAAHRKMSELGARFDEVHGPISLQDDA